MGTNEGGYVVCLFRFSSELVREGEQCQRCERHSTKRAPWSWLDTKGQYCLECAVDLSPIFASRFLKMDDAVLALEDIVAWARALDETLNGVS